MGPHPSARVSTAHGDGPLRALWVTAEPPDFDLGGGNIRQAHLLAGAAERFELHLLIAGELSDPTLRRALASVTEVERPPPPRPRSRTRRRMGDLTVALFGRAPYEVRDNRAVRRLLAPHLRSTHTFDIVVVEHSGLAPLAPARPRSTTWVLEMQNILSERAHHENAIAPARRQRWLWDREHRRAVAFQQRALDLFDAVFVCSEQDRTTLSGRGLVVPNGVDLDRYAMAPLVAAPRVVMTATLGYPPNADGAIWFCREVWPHVRSAVPDAELEIVGRQPTAEVRALAAEPGVALHFDVPTVVPYLHSARVAVVPVRVGTGTRLKALEAMAAGRPVAGTTIGLDGIGAVDGVNAAIADDPVELAARVVALLRDNDLATRLAAAARQHVEANFSWTPIAREFADRLASLVDRA